MKIAFISILTIGDPQQFSFITRLFAENGGKTNITSVSDVKDSIKKIESVPIDVIISRFDLGSLNGIEFITRLKHQIHYNPIMIFVGDEGPAIEKEALKAGIDYYYQNKGDQELETAQLNNFIKLVVKGKQSEEALHYADTNFRTIVEATEDSIYMIDRHYRYLYINTPHQKRLGILGQEYESKLYRDIHSEVENQRFIQSMNHVLQKNTYFFEEYEKEGRHYYRKFIPVKYESSALQALAVTVVSTDITDRVRLEDEVARGASLIATAFETTSDGIFVVDRAGKIMNYNQKFMEMWFIPETVMEERDEEVLLAYIEDQLLDREGFIDKVNFIRNNPDKDSFDLLDFRDGRVFERFTNPQKIGGTVIGRVWSFRDITKQRNTITTLQVTQANYRSVVESTGDSIFMVDEECCYLFMNTFHRNKLGDVADKYLEQRMKVYLHAGEEKRFEIAVARVFKTEKPFKDEFRWNDRDYIRRFTPVMDEKNEVRAVTVVLTDITERKAAEMEVKNSEERLKILFDLAPEAYFLSDIKGTFINSNRAATDLTGYVHEDLRGRNIFTMGLIASMHITKTAVLFAKNALGKPTGPDEVKITRKDGRHVYAELMTYPVRIREQSLVMTIARDITDRRTAEIALKEREEQYHLLVNNANEGVFVLRDNIIIFANPRAGNILKQPGDNLTGRSISDFMHPDDRSNFSDLIQQVRGKEGIHAGHAFRVFDKSGEIRWIEISLVNIAWSDEPALLILANDVSERKLAEDALMQSNKKLNLLSSITRHDVLNQITILLAYLDLLRKKNTDPVLAPFIEKQTDATQAIRSQIVFTKEYQDVGVRAPQWQNLGARIKAVRDSKKCDFIEWSNDLNRIEIFADPLVEKVFFNLVNNSLMHGERVTRITFSIQDSPEGSLVIIEDNGIGVPQNEKKKIFEHGYGKNTGFGLFLSREILSITGMKITENGEPGKGARFEILIPKDAIRAV